MIFAAVMLAACESGYYGGEVRGDEPSPVVTKKFTFTVKGDFKSPTFNKSKMRKAASPLFGASGETSVMLNNEWSEPYVGEW